MQNKPIILLGKTIAKSFRLFNLGNGSTWPGHIALGLNKNLIKDILAKSKTKIIIVAGTNGKTTTSTLIRHVLLENGKSVIQNQSGANLLNGIASTFIRNVDSSGKLIADYAILEIDENTLPLILKELTPDYIILLNLFRDQLDRYGEINIVASYWADSIKTLTDKTTLVLNADDPQIAYQGLGTKAKTIYFGIADEHSNFKKYKNDHTSDSGYCPKCNNKLTYHKTIFSHLGDWSCSNCKLKRPLFSVKNIKNTLPGTYNIYNTQSAYLVLSKIGISDEKIEKSLANFKPAFGRQEIIKYKNTNVQIFLSKNPTSFNQSLQTVSGIGANTILLVLNDRIPDGRDVSWIWDIDMDCIKKYTNIFVSGDRLYDMALRLKYEFSASNFDKKIKIFPSLKQAINEGAKISGINNTLFIMPTYSAMLDVRKILTGRKIQ